MLRRTFQHVPHIGPRLERRLWQSGITDWQSCLARIDQVPLGPERRGWLVRFLRLSAQALARQDAEFFARRLPPRERWRLYGAFRRRTVFLDIETTGLGSPRDVVTLVGTYDGSRARVFVRGVNMEALGGALAAYPLVVTYNGSRFDLPFLRARLPGVRLPEAHLDLRYPLARLGYRGGLKAVEGRLGLRRHPWVAGLDGYDAVRLWWEYSKGNLQALRRLVAYNLADVINLQALAAFVYNEMVTRLSREGALGAFEPLLEVPGGVLYDRLVLEALARLGLRQ